jgi:autotransporter-associated beta strand protein
MSMKKEKQVCRLLRAVGILAAGLLSTQTFAATWVGSAGSFTNAVNWDTGLVPTVGQPATIANGGTALFDGGSVTNLSAVNLGTGTAAARGTLGMSNGALSSTTFTVGGNGGAGALNLSGGTIDVNGAAGAFSVAPAAGSTGTVVMTGGTLTTANELWIGPTAGGHAFFYLNGGTVVCKSWGVVGRGSTDAWLYLNGGVWSNTVANNFTIGSGGSGVVNMGGGTLYAQNGIYVGELVPGWMTMTNGTVAANWLQVGKQGAGTGVLSVANGSLWLNTLSTGTAPATLRFSGGALGALSNNATWTAPVILTNDIGSGTITLYTGDQNGVARVNTGSGVLSGNAALVVVNGPLQSSPGTLVLSANNTFRGGVTLQGNNTLQLGAGGAAGWIVSPLTYAGGNLAFNRSDVLTNSLSINGSGGSIIQSGSGTLVLTNTAPTFSAAVANAGVLRFTDALAIPGAGASVTINSGGAVAVDGAYGTVTDWLNSGRIATSSAGSLALTGNSSEAIDLTAAGGGLYANLLLGATGAYTYSGTLTPISGVYRLGGGSGTLTYANPITGGNVSVGGGAGTVVLAANNTFAGGVSVSSGTLRVGDPNALGSGLVTVSGGTLQVNTNLQATGGLLVRNTGMVQVGAGGSITGLVTNNAVSATAGTTAGLVFNGNTTFTHTDNVAGSGELAVIGGGKLNLNTPGQTISQSGLWVGNNGSAGNLELSAGTLNVTNWILVARGTQSGTPSSTLTLSGGTLTKTGANATYVGDVNASVGTLILTNAAIFNAAGGNVGISTGNGTGTMTVYGGLLNQTANDFVVANGNGVGTVNLYGGVVSNSAGSVAIGNGAGGRGTMIVTNGVLYSKNNLYVGNPAGSFGTLNLINGSVAVTTMFVGESGTGTVAQAGGTIAISGTADPAFGVGRAVAGSVGSYVLSNGVLCLTGTGNFQIGGYGRGTFTQFGGAVTGNNWMVIGRYASSVSTATLAGGTFMQNNAATRLIVGEAGMGTLIVTNAGVANLVGGVSLGHAGGTGTVALAANGLILTPYVYQNGTGNSRSFFNFDGGTLRARGNGAGIANFMQGLTLATVKAGGAVIDSSNNFITVAQSLASGASPDGGLTKLGTGMLTLSGTNSYNGTTTISNVTLRLGVANAITNTGAIRMMGGIYDLGGFTVTNGAVTLNSGWIINGTLNPASVAVTGDGFVTASLTGSGALVKSGSGTLSLYGSSSYSGGTFVNEGTLKIQPPQPSVLAGSVAWFDAADTGTVTTNGTGQVTLWTNKGTSGSTLDAVQITAGVGPTLLTNALNGRAVLSVTGTTALWTLNNLGISGGQDRTLFVVGCRKNSGSMFFAHEGPTGANNLAFGISSETANLYNYTWGNDITLGIRTNGTYEIYDFMIASSNGTANLISGGALSSGSRTLVPNTTDSKLYLGSRPGTASQGNLAEVIVFNRALTAAERTQVEAYLQAKWFMVSTSPLPSAGNVALAAGTKLDLNGASQAVAGLSGSGLVTNGTLSVNGTVAPGGTNVIGTLTLAVPTTLSGTLLADVALDGTSDCLTVQGSLNLKGMALQIQNLTLLKPGKQYVIARCAVNGLTGPFTSTNLDSSRWLVSYNSAVGEVRLINRGLLIMIK